jgi:hypothetical protein
VLAVAASHFSRVGPEVDCEDNISEYVVASSHAFINVVEVADMSVKV